jgi:glutaredoxin
MKKVSMYTLSTCPWCRKTKNYFTERGIPFDFIDYDLADKETQKKIIQELDEKGGSGFPFVKIEDEIIVGYNPERYAKLLGA